MLWNVLEVTMVKNFLCMIYLIPKGFYINILELNAQKNGLVEQKHHHILNVVKSLSFQAHLPKQNWHFSIHHVVHLINKTPFPYWNINPLFKYYITKLSHYCILKCFGYLTYASTIHAHRTMFDPHARKTIFLDYRHGTKGYLLYDLQSHDFLISRNAFFHEIFFPLNISSNPTTKSPHLPCVWGWSWTFAPLKPTTPYIQPHTQHVILTPPTLNSLMPHHTPSPPPPHIPLRQSTRTSRPPNYLQHYHCNLLQPNSFTNTTYHGNPFLLSHVLHYDNYSPNYIKKMSFNFFSNWT